MMEGGGVGSEPKRRGRKRKNREVQNVTMDGDGKKRVLGTRSTALVGRYVRKEFEGNGLFLGKIVYYDSGLYRVDYEDGDFEDLESGEVKEFLIEESELNGEWLERKKKLDELISIKYAKRQWMPSQIVNRNAELGNVVVHTAEVAPMSVEMSTDGDGCNQVEGAQSDGYEDLSSEVSEDDQEPKSRSEVVEVPLIPPPALPPSSENFGIAEQYVSHLLSVYSFLRSFSIQLFLSPFGLEDFVGSLNCTVTNTLLESVHVALMRTLRCHLEKLSCDGSELAAKCLRFLDWSLLDTLTWPVYLVHYLMVMGYINGPEWKEFYTHAMEKNYFTLPAGRKLLVLQILCDDVLDSEPLRTEIDMREESEVGMDSDAVMMMAPSSVPRRVHPRYTKTSACKDQEARQIMAVNHERSKVGYGAGSDVDQDGNSDECRLCGMDGMLLCCDGCPSSYHSRCIGVSKLSISDGEWFCPECTMNKIRPMISRETTLKGAETFGIDPYGQVFVGSCEHLLVLEGSIKSITCLRYYSHRDIPRLLEALHSNVQHITLYKDICKEIIKYWEIPEGMLLSVSNTPEIAAPDQACLDTSIQTDLYGQSSDFPMRLSCTLGAVGQEQTPIRAAASRLAGCLDPTRQVNYRVAGDRGSGRGSNKSPDSILFMGSSFKVQGYINNYLHGDFAASAAASLTALSSDENQLPSSFSVDNPRKVISANYSLQAKAFSSAAIRFFWPHTERKLVEGPRERCSWCFACKATISSKRGCLLNAAAMTATKGAMKVLATLRPVKNVEGSIPAIATYVMFLEESLSGLTVGPFQNPSFRKQWRAQLEQATSCCVIKTLLLDLEDNIRTVAVSGDWVKLVDGWSAESSVISGGAPSAVGSTQKRRPGRRGRRPSVVAEVTADDSSDSLTDITWWRGRKLLKFLAQKATLPRAMVKRAARQGGSKRIPGVYYADGVETAKRNRRLVWRAAVDMCKNAAQLALQVRYLDLHVKWADLARPEQISQEAKGSETESSVFRNAFVCDKKIVGSEIRYGVAFGSQKHLPSKVIKNIIEKEQTEDGKGKYWFSELRIPLYLIKEYEVNVATQSSASDEKPQNIRFTCERKQLRPRCKNIFLNLARRIGIEEKIHCSSCQGGVLLGNAVKCSVCQGLCHDQCTVSSTVSISEAKYWTTCKDCYHAGALNDNQNNESPTSPLLLQGQDFPSAAVANQDERLPGYSRTSASTGILEKSADVKPTKASHSTTQSKPKCNWGLIWKKKKGESTGGDFIIRNILLKGNPDTEESLKPLCHLCNQPYSSNLMYICCEACNNWFHADAVELQEEKIFELVGFKCCKCRRIRSPVCPYSITEHTRTSEPKKLCVRGPKIDITAMGSNSGTKYKQKDEAAARSHPKTEELPCVAYDDPLLVSSSQVQPPSGNNPQLPYEWNTPPVSGPQKLPVRRNVKREKDEDFIAADGLMGTAGSAPSFEGLIGNSAEEVSAPLVEWDASTNNFDDSMMFDYDCLNYEDAEFEPQTYFSFNELLASDDGGSLEGVPLPSDATESWTTSNTLQENEHPDPSYHQQGGHAAPMDFANDTVPCKLCSGTDPCPELFCQTCSAWFHTHCSPSVEPQSAGNGGWKCTNCREWL